MSLSNHIHIVEKSIVATLMCDRCDAVLRGYGFTADGAKSVVLRNAAHEEWVEKDGQVLCDECDYLDGVDLTKITFDMFD